MTLDDGALSDSELRSVIDQAIAVGCRAFQFIGGEPTMSPYLPMLIQHARAVGADFIEVYTNSTYLPDDLLHLFVENRVSIAVSFYCDTPDIHDSITLRRGSHALTVTNIKRYLDANLPIRAGVIQMPRNAGRVPQTIEFLYGIGVKEVGVDRLREIGRAKSSAQSEENSAKELCGRCWDGRLCVATDGIVFPCIMSRMFPIGSVREQSLTAICDSHKLRQARQSIYAATRSLPEVAYDPQCNPFKRPCYPSGCSPSSSCSPTTCSPGGCSPGCAPVVVQRVK